MRNRITGAITVSLLATIIFVPAAPAQRGQRGNNPPAGPPHDPHDLSGIWLQRGGAGGGPMSEWSKEPVPFTPAGLAKVKANKPGKGPRGVVRAQGNAPRSIANAPGLMRTLVDARPFPIIPLAAKILQ